MRLDSMWITGLGENLQQFVVGQEVESKDIIDNFLFKKKMCGTYLGNETLFTSKYASRHFVILSNITLFSFIAWYVFSSVI